MDEETIPEVAGSWDGSIAELRERLVEAESLREPMDEDGLMPRVRFCVACDEVEVVDPAGEEGGEYNFPHFEHGVVLESNWEFSEIQQWVDCLRFVDEIDE